MNFSANLGFLWQELDLPDAIRAAASAGFAAVECHWPYDTPANEVVRALHDAGLPMLSLNTVRGDVAHGENGLAALPGREADARVAIDQAIDYAVDINASKIHVMAGVASGDEARRAFIANLQYATERALPYGLTILVEPLNHFDAPGYFLQTTTQAESVIADVAVPNLQLMFDCYHVQIMEGDITRRLRALMPIIGHIQFASVPDRAEPDGGELDYRHVFNVIAACGYTAPLGAEYKPRTTTDAGLGWLRTRGRNKTL